ncbi:MAG: M14 metallopeptidase family protein [Opitutales bacterium]
MRVPPFELLFDGVFIILGMMPRRTLFVLFTVALLGSAFGRSEPVSLDYYLPDGVQYNSAVPTPVAVLGFEPGEWHLRHDQIMGYLREVAAVSDRMTLVEYGRTHEEKPLYLLQVSHPDNLSRLDEIQAEQQRLIEVEGQRNFGPVSGSPLVVWLGYSVHGNEPSGANSVPLLAYHLAAARGPDFERFLRETVILIDPVLNPDGLDRFAHWANTHRGSQLVADSNHREHQQGWPSARTNHFWFDLNRDWLPLVHPESRGRLKKFHQWRPHVLGDFHEMGTDRTFFFQPGVPSRNNPLTPEVNYKLTARIAEFNARALDAIGALYYTKETFDDFYMGKASAYPDLNGSVGILFEQASSRGHIQESIHGPVTFPFTIRNQFTASLGTLQAAAAMSEELKEYSRSFYESAREEAEASAVQAYVVAASNDPVRNAAFLDLLLRHQIQVNQLARDLEIEDETFAAGRAFVIPVQQPQVRLVKSFFDRLTSFEENVFYDISTWVIPPAFNLKYAEVVTAEFEPALLGEVIDEAEIPAGEVKGESSYGYVFGWESFDAPRVLHHLLKNGLKAKVATRPFTAVTPEGRKDFFAGAIFIPVGLQARTSEEVFQLIQEAAGRGSVRIFPVTTGLATSGIDFGSPSFEMLEERKVLVAVGDGLSSGPAGEVWHLLDQRVDLAVSLVERSRMSRMNLADYDVIVLGDGSYSGVSSSDVESLEQWVRQGGTLIAFQRAARWAVSKKLASVDFIEDEESDDDEEGERLAYADADAIERLKRISGAIFSAQVDATHPLGFGFEEEAVQLFRQGTLFMKPSDNPYSTPVLYDCEPLVSGYVSDENLDRLAGSAAVIADPLGAGVVVLFADNPNFRGYWLGSSRLFLNAVFFGSAVRDISVGDEEH